jgi:hypothetical protein
MQMIDALEYERAYVEENLSKGLEIPLYTRLATLKTQQYLAEQPIPISRSTTATSFPLITKPSNSNKISSSTFSCYSLDRSFNFRDSSNE